MQEIDRNKRDRYFKDRYHLLHFDPAHDDFLWFCQYVQDEKWWPAFIAHYIGSEAISVIKIRKLLDAEQLVNAVYIFCKLLENVEPEEEKEPEKEQVTYGKAPKECPIDPKERARCPECAERVW